MKILRFALIPLFLGATFAYADLYEWKDWQGVIHITDDMGKVPESYRGEVKVHKTTPPKAVQEAPPAPPQQPAGEDAKLYGAHTLEWWLNTFNKKREEISFTESSIAAKEQFIAVFEGGRRFGQIYGDTEVATYKKYKEELPDEKKELSDLQAQLDELKRRATIVGVPKEIRGD